MYPVITLIWAISGFLSWYLSTYIFTFVITPAVPGAMAFMREYTSSQVLLDLYLMALSHISDYVLGFLFALILAVFSNFSKARMGFYIFAMSILPIYYHIIQLIEYKRYYAGWPYWMFASIGMGCLSILICSPLFASIGGVLGNFYRTRRQNV